MSNKRLDTDEAFKNIMGFSPEKPTINENAPKSNSPNIQDKQKIVCNKEQPKEKLIQVAFYITKKQKQALKLKTALGDRVEDKDQSAIVRSMLDKYLADEIKQVK